ncbi:hypothetical protein W97_06262 [Coniosporium apollinis CBS 100218]|uniref:Calcium uniporter protein n=1 Tax=Coniosporium apollinis (strain CBS 100218) TaxID=1168221 RepID=R7YY36_CONA1|nr:uncharacterized protein W97_06262 [Coniosporium apollinis CBS 100218]EON66860.1 hypothetical protein W97_06262 [Coniosporium apollinis CBS 100218]
MECRVWCSITRAACQLRIALPPVRPCKAFPLASPLHLASSSTRSARAFTSSTRLHIEDRPVASYSQPAETLSHNITEEEKADYDKAVAEDKGKQVRTPWMREGSDTPPVARQRSAGAMTKGKLLTTPSRMLKLILPLTTQDENSDRKDVEPLALLVHPQQPLSYLERLIQSELPILKTPDGKEKIPAVYFRAEDSMQETSAANEKQTVVEDPDEESEHELSEDESDKFNGGVESYSGLGREAPADKTEGRKFVRWSSSTEIGDFIRDAARGKEFAVEIEGAPNDIRVGVPSFNDRTYYLRTRLRSTARKISSMADIKAECDRLAHKGAQRVAMAGFGILIGWWYLVYRLTFETELGWDVMEPVTYLVGLSTLIGGYVWFLYHNREVSYRSAMNYTFSKRQSALYQARGFDPAKWQALVEEGNQLRREIKAIANEYDVEWDEMEDEKEEKVRDALKKHRDKSKGGKKDKGKGKDEDEE